MSPRPVRGSAPRHAAFDVIRAVSERDAYANLVLDGILRQHGVSGRDAGLATELANGTLRWRGTYDAVLARCVDRSLERLDPEVLDLLRLGSHQVLGMRVPAHASVATTVDLARTVVGRGASGFVNAVLRKVGRRDLLAWANELAPRESDAIAHLALRYGQPRWIVEAFESACGGSETEVESILAANNVPAPVALVARPGLSTAAELIDAGAMPGHLSPYAAMVDGGNPRRFAAVGEGRAGVQDEGSQLVTLALERAPLTGSDRRWVDLCAGPGGKAALLAALAGQRQARLWAVERQRRRAQLVAETAGRAAGFGGVVCADGTRAPWRGGVFDRVLVDVPCTGLGALRRRPELRWRRSPDDLASLRTLQLDLLAAALNAVRVGGVVAYVTCSPHPAETREVVAAAITQLATADAEVAHVDARPLLPEVAEPGPGPDLQLWPHRHGTDAMYLAVLRRVR